MTLTKEQIKTNDNIGVLSEDEAKNLPKLSQERINEGLRIIRINPQQPKQEPILKEQIIADEPIKAQEWENKGPITPFEAAQEASREFHGYKPKSDYSPVSYDNVIERNKPKGSTGLNPIGKSLAQYIDKNFPSLKRGLKKLNKIAEPFAKETIEAQRETAKTGEDLQGVDRYNPYKRYEVASVDRAGRAIYREIDLLDKIGFLEAMREDIVKGTSLGALAEGVKDKKLREVKEKIVNGETIYQDELDTLNEYYDKEREKIVRGYSLSGRIGSAVGMSLGLGADILAGSYLGELFGLSRAASGVGVNAYRTLRGLKAGKNVSRIGANIASWGTRSTIGAGITTGVNAPFRLSAEYQGRMLSNEIELTDSGNLIFRESEEKPATAFFKSLEKLYIMYFTEMGGGEGIAAITKGAGNIIEKGAGYVISPVMANLFKKFPVLETLITKTTSAFAKNMKKLTSCRLSENLPIGLKTKLILTDFWRSAARKLWKMF